MTDNRTNPQYKIGDVVNGHVLTEGPDGTPQWQVLPQEEAGAVAGEQPVTDQPKKKAPKVLWIVLGGLAGLLVLLLVIAGIVGAANAGKTSGATKAEDKPAASAEEEPAVEEEEPAAVGAQPLAVAETAFGFDGQTWWYAVILDNPNTDYIYANAAFTVEAIAADGTILDSNSDYTTVMTGRSAFAGDFFSIGAGQIDHLEVRGPDAAGATHMEAAEQGTFTVSPVTTATEYGLTDLTGTVTSTFAEEQTLVKVVTLARDAGGVIVASDYTFIDRIPSGGTAQFSGMIYEMPASAVAFEAYAAQ